MPNIGESIVTTVADTINRIILFIPQFVAGLIILVIGWLLALVLKSVAKRLFDWVGLDRFLTRVGLEERAGTRRVWTEIASQVVFWFVFLAFLIPAFNAWQLTNVTALLNQLLLYLPNVFAAVIIGFVGYIIANIAYNLVKNAARGVSAGAANVLGQVAKYAIYVFTALVALNQLQIASNLIQLLVAGFVAMAALAGGLAFGLGGQETARELLSRLVRSRAARQAGEQAARQTVYASEVRTGKSKKRSQDKEEKKS